LAPVLVLAIAVPINFEIPKYKKRFRKDTLNQ
jgi:hypothetical protein